MRFLPVKLKLLVTQREIIILYREIVTMASVFQVLCVHFTDNTSGAVAAQHNRGDKFHIYSFEYLLHFYCSLLQDRPCPVSAPP